jgi:hypothetical protein
VEWLLARAVIQPGKGSVSAVEQGPRLIGPGKSLLHRRRFVMNRGDGPWWTPLPRCHYAGSKYRLPLGTPLDEELGFSARRIPSICRIFLGGT